MNKQILLILLIVPLLLVGCGKTGQTNPPQQNNPSNPKSEAIDYSRYIKKTWIKNNDVAERVYFSISKIENGKITGKLSAESFASADKNLPYFISDFEGILSKDTAECQFHDAKGNKGTLKLVFKANNKMEATISLTEKSKTTIQPPEGTFEFAPDNIKNIKGFSPIESQSFMVNVNSWGNVKFVSGKLTAGNHIPTVFYLTNENGDILYQFGDVPFPYSVDVKAVSFTDVNKDGLKDVIIIVVDNYDGSGQTIATVCFQKADGSFANDPKLYEEINASGNNKDVETVKNYLSKKF